MCYPPGLVVYKVKNAIHEIDYYPLDGVYSVDSNITLLNSWARSENFLSIGQRGLLFQLLAVFVCLFFLVNTKATEKLFDLLKEWCGDHLDETVVLGMYCDSICSSYS